MRISVTKSWYASEKGEPWFTCAECNKPLKVGDEVDHYYPYYIGNNRCKGCKEKGGSDGNMAIAEAGAAINETLHKKMPDKILEIEKRTTETQVYQRGLLGGMRRIR